MERATVFAGFGGQGLLFAGEALARAALAQGMEVLWIPSYGPEMRGGTANCTVICADGRIGSPVVDHLDAAVLLNPPSLAKFLPMVAPRRPRDRQRFAHRGGRGAHGRPGRAHPCHGPGA